MNISGLIARVVLILVVNPGRFRCISIRILLCGDLFLRRLAAIGVKAAAAFHDGLAFVSAPSALFDWVTVHARWAFPYQIFLFRCLLILLLLLLLLKIECAQTRRA